MDLILIIGPVIGQLWYIIPIFIISAALRSAWFKGKLGEFEVNAATRLHLDRNKYHLIKNVTLASEDGTTQIDHIIVSIYGIFVVETKNMKGWIFGGENQKTWTQKIYKKTSTFQNPLHQNFKHVKTLETMLGIPKEKIHSVIVFVGYSTFKTDMPENVITLGKYPAFIKSKKETVLTESEVNIAIKKIGIRRLAESLKTDREHVKDLKSRYAQKGK